MAFVMRRLPVPVDEEGYTESFSLDQEQELHAFFEHYGFVVVRDVITQHECNATLDDVYTLLETGSNRKFRRDDVRTWANWPRNSIERYGSPHRPPVFTPQFLRNRQNPNVYKVFSTLLHEDNLLVNHDRCCFFRPTKSGVAPTGQMLEEDTPQWSTAANLHIDMNPHAWLGDGFASRQALNRLRYENSAEFIFENNQPSHADGVQLQGVINLYDNKVEDGGFQCTPGFHRHFDAYFANIRASPDNSYNFKPNEIPYKHGVRISMRAGSMVVWDQRMAHGSQPNASSTFRSAQFIKMFPAHTVSKERAQARAFFLRHQFKAIHFDEEVTELGKQLFGL